MSSRQGSRIQVEPIRQQCRSMERCAARTCQLMRHALFGTMIVFLSLAARPIAAQITPTVPSSGVYGGSTDRSNPSSIYQPIGPVGNDPAFGPNLFTGSANQNAPVRPPTNIPIRTAALPSRPSLPPELESTPPEQTSDGEIVIGRQRSGMLSNYNPNSLNVRIAWGGGAKTWKGEIAVDDGTIESFRSLGIEADEIGSMWLEPVADRPEQKHLMIRHRTSRTYDGVDLKLIAPRTAKLTVKLYDATVADRPTVTEIPLHQLIDHEYTESLSYPLDEQGNRLVVRRSPGDRLRTSLSRDVMIFSPGERIGINVRPHRMKIEVDEPLDLSVTLKATGRDDVLWETKHQFPKSPFSPLTNSFGAPNNEGVYELTLVARQGQGRWLSTIAKPSWWSKPIAERKVQFVVLAEKPTTEETAGTPIDIEDLEVEVEIDPTDPGWLNGLLGQIPQLGRIPYMPKQPLGSGGFSSTNHTLGRLARLKPRNEFAGLAIDATDPSESIAPINRSTASNRSGISWQAYWLPISNPGRPHVLEIEYPAGISQTATISLIEPNAAGALVPFGVDSGIETKPSLAADTSPARMQKHRLIFWPRTKTPLVLISNPRTDTAALYGKIRVLSGWKKLPAPVQPSPEVPQRLIAAYMDRPLLPENFSAGESLDAWSHRSLDDWKTFYEASTRLVEYMKHVGLGGLMMNVAADGSSIYPSQTLQPTPRYDKGDLFATGQDPIRKDVLELLFRLFDREGLTLIPAVDFSAPLPELEAIKRLGGQESIGIEWIGPAGQRWLDTFQTRQGLAPYYNTLDSRVQQAMLRTADEVIDRYRHHRSWGGLGVRLSGHGYAQLPSPVWGLDDRTFRRFVVETGVRGALFIGPDRFAQRAKFIAGPALNVGDTSRFPPPPRDLSAIYRGESRQPGLSADSTRQAWLDWRAACLTNFYRALQDRVAQSRAGAKVYLAGVEIFESAESNRRPRPSLARQSKSTAATQMLERGLDMRRLGQINGLIVPRPRRMVAMDVPARAAADLEIELLEDFDQQFAGPQSASLFYHPPRDIYLEDFDASSPYKPATTWLASQPTLSGREARRRFVHAMATLDPLAIFDGGRMLSFGEEEMLRDLIATYRRLPPVPFVLAVNPNAAGGSSQPVTFRYARYAGATYMYAVNDAPFSVSASVELVGVEPGSPIRELTGQRNIAPPAQIDGALRWSVALAPYDLIAVRIDSPHTTPARPTVAYSEKVIETLNDRILTLGSLRASLQHPPAFNWLQNPSFEKPAPQVNSMDRGEYDPLRNIPGWDLRGESSTHVAIDKNHAHHGKASAYLKTGERPAILLSEPIPTPSTGRVSVSVFMRVEDQNRQPGVRIAIEGKHEGRRFYRVAQIGRTAGGDPTSPIGSRWTHYLFQIADLPLTGMDRFRILFEVSDRSEVWIDDVRLYHLDFNRSEQIEMALLLALARAELQQRRLSNCIHLMEGYWPRFLNHYVRPARIIEHPMQQDVRIATSPSRWSIDTPTPPPQRNPDAIAPPSTTPQTFPNVAPQQVPSGGGLDNGSSQTSVSAPPVGVATEDAVPSDPTNKSPESKSEKENSFISRLRDIVPSSWRF